MLVDLYSVPMRGMGHLRDSETIRNKQYKAWQRADERHVNESDE